LGLVVQAADNTLIAQDMEDVSKGLSKEPFLKFQKPDP
jgi:hypothetical protein